MLEACFSVTEFIYIYIYIKVQKLSLRQYLFKRYMFDLKGPFWYLEGTYYYLKCTYLNLICTKVYLLKRSRPSDRFCTFISDYTTRFHYRFAQNFGDIL